MYLYVRVFRRAFMYIHGMHQGNEEIYKCGPKLSLTRAAGDSNNIPSSKSTVNLCKILL